MWLQVESYIALEYLSDVTANSLRFLGGKFAQNMGQAGT